MTDYIGAHKFSINNQRMLEKDTVCGCFYCLKIFDPKEITAWLKDTSGTAVCPYCDTDSIIGAHTGSPITREFLEKMHQHWF